MLKLKSIIKQIKIPFSFGNGIDRLNEYQQK